MIQASIFNAIHKLVKIRFYFILNSDFILNNNNTKMPFLKTTICPRAKVGLARRSPSSQAFLSGSTSLLSGLRSRQGWFTRDLYERIIR